jgi:hypothetical protein
MRQAAVLVLLGSACGAGERVEETRREPVVADSAGVRVVINQDPQWRAGEGWRVAPMAAVRIGAADGAEAYLLDRVRGVTRLSDGTIVVLNAGSTELRYYSADGVHLRSVGRQGRGPGDMRLPRWLDLLEGDVLQVTHADGRLRYAADGSLVGDDRIRWDRIHAIGRRAGVDGDGGFLMESGCAVNTPLFIGDSVLLCSTTYTDVRFIPREAGVYHSTMFLARSDWALEALDTLGTFPRSTVLLYPAGGRLHAINVAPPGGPRGRMRVTGWPRQLAYSPVDSYRLEFRSLDEARLRLIVRRVGGLRAPRLEELDRIEHTLRSSPASLRGEIAISDSLSIAAGAPHVDVQGAIWVPLEVDADAYARPYDVFAADGVYLGTVNVPDVRFTPHEIGADWMLGVTRGEHGVEFVVLYLIDR